MAKFVLFRKVESKVSLAMGVEVLGFPMDDHPIVTISDKTVNPDVTCEASEGKCLDGLTSKMAGEGWSCSKDTGCSLKVVLGSDYEVHAFSIKQRQTDPHSLVSKYTVTIGDKE